MLNYHKYVIHLLLNYDILYI